MSDFVNQTAQLFNASAANINVAAEQIKHQVAAAAQQMSDCLQRGNKILICGNGGSSSDATHLSAELLNKFYRQRRPLAAIALTTDTATITAIGNDESFAEIFSKQVTALGKPGDILLAITSSGNSGNIVEAVNAAHDAEMSCIFLNGKDGGKLSPLTSSVDIDIIAPGDSTARIQEVHGIIIHAFCEIIDDILFGELPNG